MLGATYPESIHVKQCGLNRASDTEVWEYAKSHGYTIVSKDSDFQERSILWGSPPKVIWVRMKNCKSIEIARLLQNARVQVEEFTNREAETFLILGG